MRKDAPAPTAYGDVDELASVLGMARAHLTSGTPGNVEAASLAAMLTRLQQDLFALGAHLADPSQRIAARVEKAALGEQDAVRLEGWIDGLEAELGQVLLLALVDRRGQHVEHQVLGVVVAGVRVFGEADDHGVGENQDIRP